MLGSRTKTKALQCTNGNFFLDAYKFSDLIDHLIPDQSAVHVENNQALVPAESTLPLQNDLHIPFSLESPYTLMFTEVGEAEIIWIWRRRESDLHNARMLMRIQTAVRGGHALIRNWK